MTFTSNANVIDCSQGFSFGPMPPLLALLHWPNFGGMTIDSSNSDTSNKILPKKKALMPLSS